MPKGVSLTKRKPRARVPAIERFWKMVDKSGECWTWTGRKTGHGYGGFTDGERRDVRAHRWIFEHLHGKLPAEVHVCHKCDNPPCVRPDHLFPGTMDINLQDCVSKGRQPGVKLTPEDVNEIKALAAIGHRYGRTKRIAARFNISPSTVRDVVRGDHWSWLNKNPHTSN